MTHNRFAERLLPRDAVLVLVDCQERLITRLAGAKAAALMNNIDGLAKLAQIFGVPTVLSARPARQAGPIVPQLIELFGQDAVVTRKSGDFWSDAASRAAVGRVGRREVILAGLVPGGIAATALAVRLDGYRVHVVLDASTGADITAERLGVARMTEAGVRLTSWVAMLAEFAATGAARGVAASLRENLERYHADMLDPGVLSDPLGGINLPLTA